MAGGFPSRVSKSWSHLLDVERRNHLRAVPQGLVFGNNVRPGEVAWGRGLGGGGGPPLQGLAEPSSAQPCTQLSG